MEEDEEELDDSARRGTRRTPIEVREEVVEPPVVSKSVDVRQKARVEMLPIEALPKIADITTAAMGQWAGRPPRYKMEVVVDEGTVGGRQQVRPETVITTTVARSTDAGREEGPRSADKAELGTPVFEDM